MGGYFPERMKNPNLSGNPPKLTVTPPDQIPLNKIQVPPGFQVELWAHGMPGARMMARGDKGTVFFGTRIIGRVYAAYERDGKRQTKIIAEKLTQPNGVLFVNGSLYVAAINRVFRYDNIEANLDNIPAPVEMTDAFKLPPEVHHNWKFLAFGPDKKIYFQVGAPCNVCEVNPGVHAQIRRYNLDGSGMEIVARGVRNSVGFDFHPKTGELWFTDNGRDWAGEDGFEDELNRVPAERIGAHFGFPYCHGNGQPDPDVKVPNACANTVLPVITLGPHTAALGMRFYTGKMFPADYRDAILIARRGSWNRTERLGYDVVTVRASPDGKNAKMTPFMTGFLDKAANSFWGRPVDVMQLPDGSMLVSDEEMGAVYRVSYKR
ncbi:MAG: sorbosone dehydrogenase family protein [Betaproteobacteria bacterium]|nr:sorbosone dehydrogenase family protein [Betaproteobacteria bacterium]